MLKDTLSPFVSNDIINRTTWGYNMGNDIINRTTWGYNNWHHMPIPYGNTE